MTHATPEQLEQRAAAWDSRAHEYASACIFRAEREARDRAKNLRQLAAEAREYQQIMGRAA